MFGIKIVWKQNVFWKLYKCKHTGKNSIWRNIANFTHNKNAHAIFRYINTSEEFNKTLNIKWKCNNKSNNKNHSNIARSLLQKEWMRRREESFGVIWCVLFRKNIKLCNLKWIKKGTATLMNPSFGFNKYVTQFFLVFFSFSNA